MAETVERRERVRSLMEPRKTRSLARKEADDLEFDRDGEGQNKQNYKSLHSQQITRRKKGKLLESLSRKKFSRLVAYIRTLSLRASHLLSLLVSCLFLKFST